MRAAPARARSSIWSTLPLVGKEVGIGIVGVDHQKQVAALNGVVDCPNADHTQTAHPSRIVIGDPILAAEGVHEGGLETSDSKSAEQWQPAPHMMTTLEAQTMRCATSVTSLSLPAISGRGRNVEMLKGAPSAFASSTS